MSQERYDGARHQRRLLGHQRRPAFRAARVVATMRHPRAPGALHHRPRLRDDPCELPFLVTPFLGWGADPADRPGASVDVLEDAVPGVPAQGKEPKHDLGFSVLHRPTVRALAEGAVPHDRDARPRALILPAPRNGRHKTARAEHDGAPGTRRSRQSSGTHAGGSALRGNEASRPTHKRRPVGAFSLAPRTPGLPALAATAPQGERLGRETTGFWGCWSWRWMHRHATASEG